MTSTPSRGGVRFSDSRLLEASSVQVEAVNGDDTRRRTRRADRAMATRPRRPSPGQAGSWHRSELTKRKKPGSMPTSSAMGLVDAVSRLLRAAGSRRPLASPYRYGSPAAMRVARSAKLKWPPGICWRPIHSGWESRNARRMPRVLESQGEPRLTSRSCGAAGQPSRAAHWNRYAGRRPGCRPSRVGSSSCHLLMALLACLHMLLMRAATLAAAASVGTALIGHGPLPYMRRRRWLSWRAKGPRATLAPKSDGRVGDGTEIVRAIIGGD